MKICYIMVNNCIFSKLLVNNLNKLGNEVFLITNNLDKDLNVKQYILNRGIPYGPKESMFRFAFSPLSILKVRKIIEKEKPDIIHAHYSLHAGLIASLATKRRFILSCWGSDIYMGLPVFNAFSHFINQYCLNKASLILTTSKSLADYILKNYKIQSKKLKSIQWGIDTKIFKKHNKKEILKIKKKFNINKNEFVIVSPRSLQEHYNHEYLILNLL